MKQDRILVLDLGSEENPRLAREIRALGVYSEIYPHDLSKEQLEAMPGVKGIILNGGPNRVVDGVEIDASNAVYLSGYPILCVDHKGEPAWPADQNERMNALKAFVCDACKAEANWNMENFIADQVEAIRAQVGDKKVLLALSGGVDSSVVAALLIRAIGKQLTCVHVNHGLLRKGEPEQVVRVFRDEMDANLIYVDAVDRFLDKLQGVADPEQKRKIIGAEFIRVFEEEARKLEGIEFLAQGTIYPDIIESGTKTVKAVKSHHNVGGLPEDLKFRLVEPLKMLFKDEVRACGKALGLPDGMVYRQPFPGPGLGVRIIGEITAEKVRILQEADWVLRDEMAKTGYETQMAQFFCVLPGVSTVGVMGDHRTYDHLLAIRAVTTDDFMTADWARIPYDLLAKVSNRITNEVKHINRVVYDVTSKPPATVEWE